MREEGHLLFSFTSAPLSNNKSTIFSPSLTLAAIMSGVQPKSSWTSGSKFLTWTSIDTMSNWFADAAQWMGSRPSSSLRKANLGSARRRDSTIGTMYWSVLTWTMVLLNKSGHTSSLSHRGMNRIFIFFRFCCHFENFRNRRNV